MEKLGRLVSLKMKCPERDVPVRIWVRGLFAKGIGVGVCTSDFDSKGNGSTPLSPTNVNFQC